MGHGDGIGPNPKNIEPAVADVVGDVATNDSGQKGPGPKDTCRSRGAVGTFAGMER